MLSSFRPWVAPQSGTTTSHFRRFAFVAYATVYCYAGISFAIGPHLTGPTSFLAYFVVTGTLVLIALAVIARRFGRGE